MKTIEKHLDTLKQILELIEELFGIVKRNPYLFGGIFTLCLSFYGMKFWVYTKPKSTVNIFFSSLNEKRYDKAWQQLSSKYKESHFGNNLSAFKDGYLTTSHIGNLQIDYKGNTINPLGDLFQREISYYTYYEVVDMIPKRKLSKKGAQAWNSFWVEIKEEKPIEDLRKRSIDKFKLRRSFRQTIRLIKEDSNWKISRIDLEEVGLIH